MLPKSLPALQRVAARLRLGSLVELDGSDAGVLTVRDAAGNLAPIRAGAGQGPDQIATKGQLDAASASGIGGVIIASAARTAGVALTLPPTSGVVGILLGGPAADRPAPGVFGRFWLDDAGVLSADAGSAWVVVSATTLGVGSQIGVGEAQRDPNTGALSLDLATGNLFEWRVEGAIIIGFVNPPSGAWTRATLRLINGGSAAVSHPPGTAWPGGIAPRLSAVALDFSTATQEAALSFEGATTDTRFFDRTPVAAAGDLIVLGDGEDTTTGTTTDGRPAGAARWYRRDATGTWNLEHAVFGDASSGVVLEATHVATDGIRVAVSARNDPNIVNTTHVLIFERDQTGAWVETAAIPHVNPRNFFTPSIALEGDLIAFGDLSQRGEGALTGAVRILEADGIGGWPEVARFDGDASGDTLGQSVAISSGRVAATAPQGQNGAGKIQIFGRDGSAWVVEATLLNPEADFGGGFLGQIAIEGSTVVVGSPKAGDATANKFGIAVVFENDGSGWNVRQILRNDQGDVSRDEMGLSVAISRGVITLGAPGGDFDLPDRQDGGFVRVFRPNGAGVWEAEHTFEGAAPNNNLGTSLALSGNTLAARAVGAGAIRVWRAGGSATDRIDEIEYLRSPDGSRVRARAILDIR